MRIIAYIDGFNLYHAIHDLGRPALKWIGLTESPLLGPAGNKEFLVLIENIG